MSCPFDQGYYSREIQHTHSMMNEVHSRIMSDEALRHKLRLFLESPNDLSDESHKALCRIAGIATTDPSGERK